MSSHHTVLGAAALSAALVFAAGQAAAQPDRIAPGQRSCFFVNQWRGWSSPERDVLLLKVNLNEVYRVDLAPGSPYLKSPGRFLISKVRGSNSVCSPLDLDLSLADEHGFKTPLFPRTLTKLTQAEVAALPRKDRP